MAGRGDGRNGRKSILNVELDDGICDFGAIHGSNAGSLLPIFITSNVFHDINGQY